MISRKSIWFRPTGAMIPRLGCSQLALALALSTILSRPIHAAPDQPDDEKLLQAEWRFAAPDFDDDGQIEAGLLLSIAPGWHTYGPEPGDLGVPPILKIEGLRGITVGDPRYPQAIAFEEQAGTSWGYADAVLIRFRFKRQPDQPWNRNTPFRVKAEFLLCRDICIPYFMEWSIDWPQPADEDANKLSARWLKALQTGGWRQSEP